jgi:hypothetical protein
MGFGDLENIGSGLPSLCHQRIFCLHPFYCKVFSKFGGMQRLGQSIASTTVRVPKCRHRALGWTIVRLPST